MGRSCYWLKIWLPQTHLAMSSLTVRTLHLLTHKAWLGIVPRSPYKYPVMKALQMLKYSLELWSLAWWPFCLQLHNHPTSGMTDHKHVKSTWYDMFVWLWLCYVAYDTCKYFNFSSGSLQVWTSQRKNKVPKLLKTITTFTAIHRATQTIKNGVSECVRVIIVLKFH